MNSNEPEELSSAELLQQSGLKMLEPAAGINLLHDGFCLAETTPEGGWRLRLGGHMVPLDELIDNLTALRGRLDLMRDAFHPPPAQ